MLEVRIEESDGLYFRILSLKNQKKNFKLFNLVNYIKYFQGNPVFFLSRFS